jgi:chemotaxis protein MotA
VVFSEFWRAKGQRHVLLLQDTAYNASFGAMRLIVGILVVFLCVFGGYAAMGGHLEVLWQPWEYVIILGAAIGAFIIGNTGPVIKGTLGTFGSLIKGPKYNKAAYIELLAMQFSLYKLVQSKGILALEQHIENPHESALFNRFPKFAANHHAVEFVCDYLRMVTLGSNNVHEMEALMDEELETHHQEQHRLVSAVQALADGTPALGIVAAVLGVIKTMGAISEPPEVLGHMIGGALVGTFFGVFVAYGFFGPMAQALRNIYEAESKYFLSLKAGLLAHISGQVPVMAIEFARKALMSEDRPTFAEVDEATANLSAA